MKPEIKVQYSLMTKALHTLNDLEILEGMFIGIDNEYLNKEKAKLQMQYANIMGELAAELYTIANRKMTVIVHEEIKY